MGYVPTRESMKNPSKPKRTGVTIISNAAEKPSSPASLFSRRSLSFTCTSLMNDVTVKRS